MKAIALGIAAAALAGGLACVQPASAQQGNDQGGRAPAGTGQNVPGSGNIPVPNVTAPNLTAPGIAPAGAGHAHGAAQAPALAHPGASQTADNMHAARSAGGNSFTRAQAIARLEAHGYTHITGLRLDKSGIWRGNAVKDGKKVVAWLDYRGDTGQDH